MKRRVISVAVVSVLVVVWWLWVAEWLNKPQSYRLVTAYLVIGIISAGFHTRALFRFIRMVRNVRKDERLGLAEPGSTVFAINQRFRYTVRVCESALIVAVSALGILSIKDTGLRTSHTYIRLVVTYLVGTVVLTGYLTIRDLRVVNFVRRVTDEAAEDAAVLATIRSKRDDGEAPTEGHS